MKRNFNIQVLATGLCAVLVASLAPAALAQQARPPATHPFAQSKPIPGRYIVVLKNSVADPKAEAGKIMQGVGGQLHHTYARALKGFAATLSDAAVQGIRNNPNVDYIEQDQTVSLRQVQSPQNQATWGLDRIDQTDRPLDTQYQFSATGRGVNAFIIDTGIRQDHVEFTGRLLAGYNVVADSNGTNDCNGHGTHVAGTVGGSTWGVAKEVALIPVRVLDCSGSGSYSGVIAGIDWVSASTLRPAVANMSLGGGLSTSVNAAVAGAVSKGVTMVVAAGNNNASACDYSPASEPSAITVGATDSSDVRASYSNYGSCVDIFAPGSAITSAWITSPTASISISGTSMAAPHVAGVAALALAANPAASPAAIATFLTEKATPNRLSAIGTASPNLLVYSLAGGPAAPPANQQVAVKALSGKSAKSGAGWKAYASVTIRDINTLAAVSNAKVTGSFLPGGTASCITDSTGNCTLASALIRKVITSTVMTMNDVSGANMTYDASQNAAASITILKP
jgi:subtilisin family serine protease